MRRLRVTGPRLAAVTALTALSVAGCGLSSASTSSDIGGIPSGTPITIGISLPKTGGFQADGIASEQGYQLWASDVNSHGGLLGRPVKLIIRNDNSDPNKVTSDYNVLINQDHVDLLMAPFSSLLTSSAIPVANKNHYALFAGSAGAPAVYAFHSSYFFSTNVPVTIQMVPFARWVAAQAGIKTAAYAVIDDPFADPPVKTTASYLAAHGVTTVFNNLGKPIEPAASQAKTNARIKAVADEVAKQHPDVVVLGTVDVPSVQAFIQEFKAKNFNPKVVIAAAGPDQGQAFYNAVGNDSVGVMVPNGWYGGYQNALSHVMVQEYIAKYGGTADGINADVAEAFSAGQTLQQAVEGTQSTDNGQVANYLHSRSHIEQTVLGPVSFNSDGENLQALNSAFIFQWMPGEQFVQVLPASDPLSTKPIYPKPPWA